MIPLLLHTPGEPAGIGPELLLRLAQQPSKACRIAVADPGMLQRTADDLGINIDLAPYQGQRRPSAAGQLWLLPQTMSKAVAYGQPDPANANYLLNCLKAAVQLAREPAAAMVTGPLNKAVINAAGTPFTGHTEFIAEQCGGKTPVMLLTSGSLRVALATTHLPLRDVPAAVTQPLVEHCLRVLLHDLAQRFGLTTPRIAVCGLNPHAGEGGHLGDEEIRVIRPAIEAVDQGRGYIDGPWPADTLFTRARLEGIDAVLSMYHDQGLPVLKHAGFGHAVNVTLGLPIIRTSVDHGTALDIAGQGKAHLGSLQAAEDLALEMSRHGT